MIGRALMALVLVVPSVCPQASGEEKANELNEQGVALYKQKNYGKAVSVFEEAGRLDPKNETIPKNLARALHGRAHGHRKTGQLDAAEDDLDRAIALDGTEPAFNAMLADLHVHRRESSKARLTLEKALEKHPESADLFESLGRLEYYEEFLKQALECLETAARLDPSRGDAAAFKRFMEKVRREVKVEGEFFRDARGQFTVKYDDKGSRAVGTAALDLLEASYNRMSADFRRWPKDRLTVVLYTRDEYSAATGAHAWTGGLFDGKIRIPVRNWRSAPAEIRKTLDHELAHWFIRKLNRRIPTWLNEGMAQLQEGKKPGGVTYSRIKGAVNSGRYEPVGKLPPSWASIKERDRVSLYYAQALHFTDFLVRRYGWSALAGMLEGWAPGQSFTEAFNKALSAELGLLEQDWLRRAR